MEEKLPMEILSCFNEELIQGSSIPTVENKIQYQNYSLGMSYLFLVNTEKSAIIKYDANLIKIHHLKRMPQHLKELVDLEHPDDIPYLMDAEAWIFDQWKESKKRNSYFIKGGYSLRMRTHPNIFELFYRQIVLINPTQQKTQLNSLHIHTNINHILEFPNYMVSCFEYGEKTTHHQTQLSIEPITENISNRLTKRELEIFMLLMKGLTDKEISETLFLSHHTVRTHHKNILKKTKTKNSKELIKKTLERRFSQHVQN